ncbi:TPA: hypothetical protein KV183_003907 [Morganella morganii]|nr:hypothetical protein [Morganella morganii]
MTESNQEKYTHSLLADHDKNLKNSKDNILKIKLKAKTIHKIVKIKSYMEWDTDTTFNSALTYLYKNKTLGFDGFSKYTFPKNADKVVKFSPTFKNFQRLKESVGNAVLDLDYVAVIICESIDELHSILLKADE